MDDIKNQNNFIELNKSMRLKILSMKLSIFKYNEKKYYAKRRNYPICYNELIAEELANDYDISCAHYESNNSLKKIRSILTKFKYNSQKLTENEIENLMDKIINMFMFDILIANIDRNSFNYGLLIKDNLIDLAPLFDNEAILDPKSLNESIFSLRVDNEFSYENRNMIEYFFDISQKEYFNKFKSKIWIISSENINNIFNKIEYRTKTTICDEYKMKIKNNFEINYKKLNKIIDKKESKKFNL